MLSAKNKAVANATPVIKVFLSENVLIIPQLNISEYCMTAVQDSSNPIYWILVPNKLTMDFVLETNCLVLTQIKLPGDIPAISVRIYLNGEHRKSTIEDVIAHLNTDGRYTAIWVENKRY